MEVHSTHGDGQRHEACVGTRTATWEQRIHVLQTQNCLAAVPQNLQQKGGRLTGRSGGQSSGELWGISSCSSEAWRTQEGRYHSNTEVSWEYWR